MPRTLDRTIRLAGLLAAATVGVSCSKPTPIQLTMVEIERSWNALQRLYDKPAPNGASEYAAEIGKLLASSDITSSKAYTTQEAFRELTADTLEELGTLQAALASGSSAQATGSITHIKELCQRCHDQKWPK